VRPLHAGICIFEGVDEIDAVGPYAVLTRARRLGVEVRVELATWPGGSAVTTAGGMVISGHAWLRDLPPPEFLVVPGGGWNVGAVRGARAQAADADLLSLLRRLHAAGTVLAGACTGAMILAAAGLLAGRRATTHRHATEELRRHGVQVEAGARVVDDGDVITSGGVTGSLDLGLWIVERCYGKAAADRVAGAIEYERRGPITTVGHATGGSTPDV
jgi:transcriptional regulator GlxA family with amidase domain